MKSAIIQAAVTPGGIPVAISEMLKTNGLYLGSGPNFGDGAMVPVWVCNGIAYSMKCDAVLNPTRFIPGTQLDGPFRPALAHEKHQISPAN